MKRYIFAGIFGLGGAAILLTLCFWQVQRLAWKEALIAEIEAKVDATPDAMPGAPTKADHRFLAVETSGEIGSKAIHVLTSQPNLGPGYRVIASLQLSDGRHILIDRGFIRQSDKDAPLAVGDVSVIGNLDWPQETDSYTPDPDTGTNIWFARDLPAMAAHLGTDPVLLVASTATGDPSPLAMPVTVNLRNNHLQYAITWALMATVWLAMTAYLVIRIRRNTA